MSYPTVGAIGTVRTDGWVASVIRFVTRSPVNHAFVAVGKTHIVEAEPHGAEVGDTREYAEIYWLEPPSAAVGSRTAAAALALVGSPYGFADIVTIGLLQYKIKPPILRAFVRWETRRRHRLICSQLCDLAAQEAGWHLFDDGRDPGDVSPGDLYRLSVEQRVRDGAR